MSDVSLPILATVSDPGLLFGLLLTAAIVGGYLARLIHVPRVVGFLLGGMALRAGLGTLMEVDVDDEARRALKSAIAPLHTIKDLALGLILFTIGSVLERSKLRAAGAGVLKIGLLDSGCTALFVFVLCAAVGLIGSGATPTGTILTLSLLLALASMATAPAATLFVLQEHDARGSVTDAILGLTAINNIVCIVAFQAVFLLLASAGAIETRGDLGQSPVAALAFSTLGSVIVGLAVGTGISILHAKLPLAETLLFFFATFILLGAGEKWLWHHYGTSYNYLLTALVIGGVFANIAIDPGKLQTALRTVASPIFVGFFVMAGYALHVDDLSKMGWVGGAYVVARAGGKWAGCRWGVRWAGGPPRAQGNLGSALLCQAAVVIGLAEFVRRNWNSETAAQFATIVMGSVVVFELVGPLLVKRCVVQAGEVKAITLLSRAGAGREGRSILGVTVSALMRLLGIRRGRQLASPESLTVQHIMRTNVQFIQAAATFNEVLHEIERSTHAHFPVVDDHGDFAGMIHFSDVRDVIYDPSLVDLVAAVDLADAESSPVGIDMPLRELLDVFKEHNVSVLPVAEQTGGKHVVGLVEQRDLLKALHLSRATR